MPTEETKPKTAKDIVKDYGSVQVEELLSEEGEQANIENNPQANAERTRKNLHLLNVR